MVALLAVSVGVAFVLLAPSSRAEDENGLTLFDTNCLEIVNTFRNIDPLRFPGELGTAHLHRFFGNEGINPNSTGQSLTDFLDDDGGNDPEDDPLPDGKSKRTTCTPVGVIKSVANLRGTATTGGSIPADADKPYRYSIVACKTPQCNTGNKTQKSSGWDTTVFPEVRDDFAEVLVSGANNAVNLTWDAFTFSDGTNAVKYKIYRGQLAGANPNALVTEVMWPARNYTDTSASPPLDNPGGRQCTRFDPSTGECPAEREKDKAAYWIPTLVACTSRPPDDLMLHIIDGEAQVNDWGCFVPPLQSANSQGMHVYYKLSGLHDGDECTPGTGNCAAPFEIGFAQIAGQKRTDNIDGAIPSDKEEVSSHHFRCMAEDEDDQNVYENIDDDYIDLDGEPGGPAHPLHGNANQGFKCGTSGTVAVRMTIEFAMCWNGTLFDQDQNHVRYKDSGGLCPRYFGRGDGYGGKIVPKLAAEQGFEVAGGASYYYRLAVMRHFAQANAGGASKLAESNGGDASSYTTSASLTPSANKLYLATVRNAGSLAGSAGIPALSGGGGLTWVQIKTQTAAGGLERVTVFRAMKPSGLSSGTLTTSFGTVQGGYSIAVDEFENVDTGGDDGSGAIVQSTSSSGTATFGSVALSAFGDAVNNLTFGAFTIQANESITAESGYVRHSNQGHTNPSRQAATESRLNEDTSVSASWTSSVAWAGIAIQIKNMARDMFGSTSTAHMDFFNAWREGKLEELVDSCLNEPQNNDQAPSGCQVSP